MKIKLSLMFIAVVVIIACSAFFFKFHLPIPADTIVGLYYPFRDLHAAQFPNSIPYKNFLITDPVRQIIPWKSLVVSLFSQGQLPLWNPYQFSGTPLLANFQSSPFYPLNLLLFIKPFYFSWSVFVVLQLLLAATFMYLYLKSLHISIYAVVFGTITFIFSGFFTAWFEWGTIISTILWLPLVLLSIDKLVFGIQYSESCIMNKKLWMWSLVFVFSLSFSLFAGHLQTFFYVAVFSLVYFLARWVQYGRNLKNLFLFTIITILFLILSSIQWYPTLVFIQNSSRAIDLSPLQQTGWFLPWQQLAQFIAPDFFGNVTTLNYWGTWNYGELIGYIGIISLIFVIFSWIGRRDKKTWFYTAAVLVSFLFMLNNPISILPFTLHIPFLSTAQPTRLFSIVCFSLAVLSALGFDRFVFLFNEKRGLRAILISSILVLVAIGVLWSIVLIFGSSFRLSPDNLQVAKRNLVIPTFIFAAAFVLVNGVYVLRNKKWVWVVFIFLILLQTGDMIHFFQKFEPFVNKEYFFEQTPIISYLQNHAGYNRIAILDSRILPPNFPTYYHLQSIEGYDPLYLQSYAEFIAAMERNKPDIKPPFGYNRIITPHSIQSPLFQLLAVKYVLSFNDVHKVSLTQLKTEGQTKLYEINNPLPRVFFVSNVENVLSKESAIQKLFTIDYRKNAIIENGRSTKKMEIGSAKITRYTADSVIVSTRNKSSGFLVLLDTYYPTWKVYIDGQRTKLYKTDYTFRGVYVPKGNHLVEFKDTLL